MAGGISRRTTKASVTAGLKCAPDTGPKIKISTADRAGRQRIAEESERAVTARKLRRHDARADDSREQECASEKFSGSASRQVGAHASAFAVAPAIRPISRSLPFSVM